MGKVRIMKVSKLKHIIREEILRELQYPKNKYIEVTDPNEIDELKDTLFKLIQTAYAPIGGHVKFKSPSDVLDPELTFWRVADVDDDPEVDVTLFGKETPHGTKISGMGHDGEIANIKNLLIKFNQILKTTGTYIEVSGPAYDSLVGKGGAPTVDDEETVMDILGPRRAGETTWHGEHPTDPSKKGNGWYTRTIGGGEHTKIMAGIPK